MGLEVKGLDSIVKNLYKVSDKADKITNDALRVGGQILVNEVKRTLSHTNGTGELRKTIKLSTVKLDSGGTKFIVVKQGSQEAWYGHILEKGTFKSGIRKTKPRMNKRYKKKAKSTGEMNAIHFMENAKRKKEREVVKAISEILEKGLL